jgi:DNA-binding PadR family transcriptional regulator
MFLIPGGPNLSRIFTSMPPSRTGDLSASIAVLGLVVERPDTVASVGVRLGERFPRAYFSRNAAHNNLPSLARQGFVEVVNRGAEPSLDRYEATPSGLAHFQKWVRESTAVPPALRDALQGKLEFSGQGDLLALLKTVCEEEDACAREYAVAHRHASAARRLRHRSTGKHVDLSSRLRGIQIVDEANLWSLMVQRLRRLREELEELVEEMGAVPPQPGVRDG